jgi:murein DD-endopeptidase MepM/ murein hydrolase activator NlpD
MFTKKTILYQTLTSAALLLSTACTQNPAHVEMKGHQVFGRAGVIGDARDIVSIPVSGTTYASTPVAEPRFYSEMAPAARSFVPEPAAPVSRSAAVTGIGVSDLAPPKQDFAYNDKAPAPVETLEQRTARELGGSPFAAKSVQPAPVIQRYQEEGTASYDTAAVKPYREPETNYNDGRSQEVVLLGANEKQLIKDDPAIIKPLVKQDKELTLSQTRFTMQPDPSAVAKASHFIWPVSSKKVVSSFGPKGSGKQNDGINIASTNGEPVWAAGDGEVVYVGNALEGYGNMVIIKHLDNKSTTYAHLSRAIIDKYEKVKQGDIIGYVGNNGRSQKAELHFAVRDGNTPLDPETFLRRSVASLR